MRGMLQENILLTLISRSSRECNFQLFSLRMGHLVACIEVSFCLFCQLTCCGFKTYPHLDAKQRKTKKWPYSCLPSPARFENDFENKLKVKVEWQFVLFTFLPLDLGCELDTNLRPYRNKNKTNCTLISFQYKRLVKVRLLCSFTVISLWPNTNNPPPATLFSQRICIDLKNVSDRRFVYHYRTTILEGKKGNLVFWAMIYEC